MAHVFAGKFIGWTIMKKNQHTKNRDSAVEKKTVRISSRRASRADDDARKIERWYFKRIKKGDMKARDEFIRMNQGLVVSLAARYAFSREILPDLISEGNLGLMKAIERFELSKHTKFSTYAYFWVKRYILRLLMSGTDMFKVPEKVHMLKDRYNQIMLKAKLERNEIPHDTEIADELDIELPLFKKYKPYFKTSTMPAVFRTDEDEDLDVFETTDFEPDKKESNTVLETQEILNRLFNRLKAKERRAKIDMWIEILKDHFGITDGIPHSYKEIAARQKQRKLSRQRIHQIIKECLKKLQREFKEMKNEGLI